MQDLVLKPPILHISGLCATTSHTSNTSNSHSRPGMLNYATSDACCDGKRHFVSVFGVSYKMEELKQKPIFMDWLKIPYIRCLSEIVDYDIHSLYYGPPG